MLMFRSPQAEQNLSANNYAALVDGVLGDGLKNGSFHRSRQASLYQGVVTARRA